MGPLDLAPQILQVVRALVENPGAAVRDALSDIAETAGDELQRIQQQAQRAVDEATAHADAAAASATKIRDAAEQKLADAVTEVGARITAAEQAATDALAAGQQAIAAAEQRAERLRAAAPTDVPSEIAAAEARAQQLVDDARAAADAARQRAEQQLTEARAQLDAVRAALTAELDQAAAAATAAVQAAAQALADVPARLDAELARLTAAVQQAAAAVTALPGTALALAEDARRQVAGVLEQNVSLVGLITQALVWLKDQCFPDDDELQVVAYHAPPLATGVGISWVRGDMSVLVAFVPDLGPLGGLVIKTAKADGGPIDLATGSSVQIRLATSGDPSASLTFGAPSAPTGDGRISLAIDFDTSALRVDERFLQAEVGTPDIELVLSSTAGEWHYRAAARLAKAGWHVDFARLLAPIPNLLPVPGLGESRTYAVEFADGVFGYTEVNA